MSKQKNLSRQVQIRIRDTHRENFPSTKTEAPTKSISMYIWAIGALNQLFERASYTQIKFSRSDSFVWRCCAFIRKTLNLETVFQFFKKCFSFSENLFQS